MAFKLKLTTDEYEELADPAFIQTSRMHWHNPVPPAVLKNVKKSPNIGFAPCNLQARQVASLIALGNSPEEVASALLIDPALLRFYYAYEIGNAVAIVNSKVGHVALKMALDGEHPDMTRFWLRSRGKGAWTETQKTEIKIDTTEVSQAREKLLGPRPELPPTRTNDPETLEQNAEGVFVAAGEQA